MSKMLYKLAFLFLLVIRTSQDDRPNDCSSSSHPVDTYSGQWTESQLRVLRTQIDRLFGNSTTLSQRHLKQLLRRLGIGRVYMLRSIKRTVRSIGDESKHDHAEEDHARHDPQEGHSHMHENGRRHKLRNAPAKVDTVNKADSHESHMKRHFSQCLERKQLLRTYGLSVKKDLSLADFLLICPSIVEQASSGVCSHQHNSKAMGGKKEFSYKTDYEVWGYGFLAITIISLSALCVIGLVPLIGRKYYKTIMAYLVALAIGTLSGDALLHLIPHSLVGDDDHDHSSEHGDDVSHNAKVWRACFVLLGIYVFFVIDQTMKWKSLRKKGNKNMSIRESFKKLRRKKSGSVLKRVSVTSVSHTVAIKLAEADGSDEGLDYTRLMDRKSKGKEREGVVRTDGVPQGALSDASDLSERPESPSSEGGTDQLDHSNVTRSCIVSSDSTVNLTDEDETQLSAVCGDRGEEKEDSRSNQNLGTGNQKSNDGSTNAGFAEFDEARNGSLKRNNNSLKDKDNTLESKIRSLSLAHSHGGDHGHSHGSFSKASSVASIAWMVIVGDGFHNFSDGLAVGAAFAASLSSGIGTGIAVLCHELPHELGDFAVLLQAGMTVKQAIAYNLVSAFLSYVGLVVGIMIGNNATGREFVLALTAGLFLYISLATMLPQLKEQSDSDGTYDCFRFFWQQFGMLTGIAIMLVISIFEKQF